MHSTDEVGPAQIASPEISADSQEAHDASDVGLGTLGAGSCERGAAVAGGSPSGSVDVARLRDVLRELDGLIAFYEVETDARAQ